ncbi:deoxyribodipyrimidine photo-lyase [Roseivivax sp. THAF30]|uniref:cryptochrome/photolyase family protein n=1 Tax=Roseivivax sp. THAF30 TaxID=2587852 RepID=UPI00126852EB|nr:deoxyribodipyrimidine photo-lyase [Roseivivax sp. THAF30]QFT63686.1 Deoxyribodipyrimidine photo-lyase [Roseivivax sp. THAF30]
MADTRPTILWHRRDLRLSDHPALDAAASRGGPVIPVFIRDNLVDKLGTAPVWRLGLGLGALGESYAEKGSRLILRAGPPLEVLRKLVEETGAGAVYWMRAYDADSVERDERVKSGLKDDGLEAKSFAGHLMFEPWSVETKQGEFYKVYTPFWRAVKDREVPEPIATPGKIPAPADWPASDALDEWSFGAGMDRGADVVRPYVQLGESAAQARLGAFVSSKIGAYKANRDIPAVDGTSNLSENLALGEITPHQCWAAGMRALNDGKDDAQTFLQELVWREFAYHLLWHTPQLETGNWREEWDAFPWNEDERKSEVIAWKRARTGMAFVDAALREMYVTGRMHNRGRMIVASYLCKHLMCHWKIGKEWFEDCLIDWDPASNAMGWQWSAGSGPDATPYFRVFNPETQVDRFDKDRTFINRWIAEGQNTPPETALSYFEAIPRSWKISPDDDYPEPIVGAKEGRQRALDAYENRDF